MCVCVYEYVSVYVCVCMGCYDFVSRDLVCDFSGKGSWLDCTVLAKGLRFMT